MKVRIVKDRLYWNGKGTSPQGYVIMRRIGYGPERHRQYGPCFLTMIEAEIYCRNRGLKL